MSVKHLSTAGSHEPETISHSDPLAYEAAARRDERVPLRHGKLLQVTSEDDHDRVVLIGKTGRIELTLEITESGARVVLDAADLAIRAKNKVAVECDTFDVTARQFTARATESATIEAPDASLHATEGDLSLRANDDVKVNGERVLLSSDGDLQIPSWMKEELGAQIERARADATIPATDLSGDESLWREFEAQSPGPGDRR
jgi:hypothetical protein